MGCENAVCGPRRGYGCSHVEVFLLGVICKCLQMNFIEFCNLRMPYFHIHLLYPNKFDVYLNLRKYTNLPYTLILT